MQFPLTPFLKSTPAIANSTKTLQCLYCTQEGPMYTLQVAEFMQHHLWDETTQRLRRSFCRNPSAVQGFADDYAFLISKTCLTSESSDAFIAGRLL